MAKVRAKGSIINKLIILVLAVALIATILYPKILWEKQNAETKKSRENMMHLYKAQLIYLFEKGIYTDTLDNVINLIKGDSTERLLFTYLKNDSILAHRLFDELSQSSDTASAIIDSIRTWSIQTGVDTVEAWTIDSLMIYPRYRKFFRERTASLLDEIAKCPTTGKPYKVTVVDTSVIKVVNIESPIDSTDILAVNADFVKHRLGGLVLQNHGKLENGEPSWKK